MTPTPETLAIAFGSRNPRSRLWRPKLGYCFSVFVDPAIDTFGAGDMVREALTAMVWCTDGDVGFDWGPERRGDEVRIVLDGARPGVGGVPGAYAGLCTPDVRENEVVGAEIVLNDRYLRFPNGRLLSKGVLHEIGHGIGFGDVEFEQSVMGGLDHHATMPTELDRAAWRWVREQPIGALRPGSLSSLSAPLRTIIDPPPEFDS